jgi:hypothetical protein
MGEAAARKVTEIDEARERLETDLREIEERLPSAIRSIKAVAGVVLGSALVAFALRRARSRRSAHVPAAEVVVRVVREDQDAP